MKTIIDKVNNSYNLAVIFFLFSGSLYFIYYSFSNSKFSYILVSILIYILSLLVRKVLLKVINNQGFSEPGIFFISFLLTAYVLYLSKIDTGIGDYLPDKILLQVGSSFFFIILISFFTSFQKDKNKFIVILLIMACILFIQLKQGTIDTFLLKSPQVINYIVGIPIVYLISVVFGIKDFVKQVLG